MFGFDEFAALVGGLAFFLYGIFRAQSGLQRASGGTLKAILTLLTRRPIAAAGVGFGLTTLTQSSSAVAVVLIGMVGTGLVGYSQSIAVLLGADVATTLTVQMLAFEFESWALLIVALGTLLALAPRAPRQRAVGNAVFGFGLLFFGMHLMKTAALPLASSERFAAVLATLGSHPVLGVLAGTVGTSIIQSSGAMVGLVLALSQAGAIDLPEAIPIVLGANIGTAATGLIAAVGANREGRRVAITHVIEKAFGVAVLLAFVPQFAALTLHVTDWMGGSPARGVANAHTLFNVGKLVVLLPFTGLLARAMLRLMPPRAEGGSAVVRYLIDTGRDSPALVFIKLWKELANAAEVVARQFKRLLRTFDDGSLADVDHIRAADQEVDALYLEITRTLRHSVREELTPAQVAQTEHLLYLVKDVELLGDSIAERLADAAEEKIRADATFSVEGQIQFRQLGRDVGASIDAVVSALRAEAGTGAADEPGRAPGNALADVLGREERLDDRVNEMSCAHLRRAAAGVTEAVITDSAFTNAVGEFRRMHAIAAGMAAVIAGLPATEKRDAGRPPAVDRTAVGV